MKSFLFLQAYAQLFEKEITRNTLTHNMTAKNPSNSIKIVTKTHITAESKQKHHIKAFSTLIPLHYS